MYQLLLSSSIFIICEHNRYNIGLLTNFVNVSVVIFQIITQIKRRPKIMVIKYKT